MPTVDVIVPVFRNLEATRRCVESVLGSSCRTPYELVLVNDGTPEPELARFLRELKERGHATLVEQPSRQGYAAAVNRAFALHRDRDVVVLQSDAEVANDWLDRLVPQGDVRATASSVHSPTTPARRRIRCHATIIRCRRDFRLQCSMRCLPVRIRGALPSCLR